MNFTKRSLYRILLCLVFSAFTSVAGAHYNQAAGTDTMPHHIQDNTSGLTAEFDKLIASESKSAEPGGVMLVAQKGQVIYRKAFGMANMELEVPMKENMVFHIGSLTKQITAVAILQLMEQGKLSLQDDIRKYLPDYQVLTDTVTIEHLLTHTSGMASEADPKGNNKSPGDLVDRYKNQPAEFAAGAKWSYNNANYLPEADNKLYFQRPGGIRHNIKASAKDNFFFDKDYLWIELLRDSTGSLNKLGLGRVGIATYYWSKTDKPIPVLLSTKVADTLMQQYAGKYAFSAGDTVTIIKEGAGIVAQPKGKEKHSTYAETEQIFCAIKEDARFEFRRNRSGIIDKLIWYQGKEKKEARKIQ